MSHFFLRRLKKILKTESMSLLILSLAVSVLVIAAQSLGIFQSLEFRLLDQFFQWRPLEAIDSRIVVVNMTEADLRSIGQWPIADATLAQLINRIESYSPRIIGLDIYRDLPVEPGHETLVQTFAANPNLIGAEKIVGESVRPPLALAAKEQVGFVDLIIDPDGKVRRGLLSMQLEGDPVRLSFATQIALRYLEVEGVTPQVLDGSPHKIRLGQGLFTPFEPNNGGYVNADGGGYQVLLNYRGDISNFRSVSFTRVLEGDIPDGLLRDRIVIIGGTAESFRDFFQTPYGEKMPGVIIHANVVSSIISTALEGRPLLKTFPGVIDKTWVIIWGFAGTVLSWRLLQVNFLAKMIFPYWTTITIMVSASVILMLSYFCFLGSWWLPSVSALVALTLGGVVGTCYYSQKLRYLVTLDALTKVANRRCFDQFLARQAAKSGIIALILCDIDYFKLYNDCYGHQAGDECLKKVAASIGRAVRSTDLVARYGGEEFAIVLPRSNIEEAHFIAERILQSVRDLKLVHVGSKVSPYVTLSCGVSSLELGRETLMVDLILHADRALYLAKEKGRNQVVVDHS